MRMLGRRHVPEEELAELATGDRTLGHLSASDRQHLAMCDRCQGLTEGHRRVSSALASPWQFVTIDEHSSERGFEQVRGKVSGGSATGRMGLTMPLAAAVTILLLVAIVGMALLGGGSKGPKDPGLAIIAAISPAPTISPTPTPIEPSLWLPVTSAHYGLQLRRPAAWQSTPAIVRWDLVVDQSGGFLSSTDRLMSPDGSATFAAYGMTIPAGKTSDEFIEMYRAPNLAGGWVGPECFPPPSTWEQIPIDGHVAGLTAGCSNYIEAIVFVGRRVYIFSGYGSLAVDRPLFDAILSTIRLHPENADDLLPVASPSPAPSS